MRSTWWSVVSALAILLANAVASDKIEANASRQAAPVSLSHSCHPGSGWHLLTRAREVFDPPPGIARTGVATLATVPDQPGMVYAGGDHGLYRSGDCGATWERVPTTLADGDIAGLGTPVNSVAACPGGRLYVGMVSAVVLASADKGASWYGARQPRSRMVTASATDECIAYAIRVGPFNDFRALIRSEDAGLTWDVVPGPSGFFATIVAADSANPDAVYLVGGACQGAPCPLYRIVRGATTVERLASFSNAIRALTVNADGSALWVGTSAGELYRSLDSGDTFEMLTQTPGGVPISAIASDPMNSNHAYVALGGTEIWAYRQQ
jgi:hypothetical protein